MIRAGGIDEMEKEAIKIGDKVSMSARASDETICKIAEISGDYNPIHVDEEYAKASFYGKRIAHGLFCMGLVSNLIGNQLPGKNSVFLSETVRYLKPVYVDDEVICQVEVLGMDTKNRITLGFQCKKRDDVVVMDGTALVKVL